MLRAMEDRRQHSVVLILSRELASNVATPMFIVDPQGVLVFYNEAAERLLGRTYAEAGELGPNEWGTMFRPRDERGTPLPVEALPLTIAFAQRRPSHRLMTITSADGTDRRIAVTAFPLMGTIDDVAGAVAIFWEHGG